MCYIGVLKLPESVCSSSKGILKEEVPRLFPSFTPLPLFFFVGVLCVPVTTWSAVFSGGGATGSSSGGGGGGGGLLKHIVSYF